jgi:hypothetical protein
MNTQSPVLDDSHQRCRMKMSPMEQTKHRVLSLSVEESKFWITLFSSGIASSCCQITGGNKRPWINGCGNWNKSWSRSKILAKYHPAKGLNQNRLPKRTAQQSFSTQHVFYSPAAQQQ